MRALRLIMASWLCGTALLSTPALADIPPPDACLAADVGKACNDAVIGQATGQPGICQQDTCTRATPDGSMTYECYLCKAQDAGSGGDSGSSAGSSSTTSSKSDDDGGGCSVASASTGGLSALLTAVAALGFALTRRRAARRGQ